MTVARTVVTVVTVAHPHLSGGRRNTEPGDSSLHACQQKIFAGLLCTSEVSMEPKDASYVAGTGPWFDRNVFSEL